MSEETLPSPLTAMQVQGLIGDAYKQGLEYHKNAISVQLIELPEVIRMQSLKLAELLEKTEDIKQSLERIENDALELVLCATEEGRAKFTNDKARKVAQEQILKENKLYCDSLDDLKLNAALQRKEQIELNYLQDKFKAYIAIAGM